MRNCVVLMVHPIQDRMTLVNTFLRRFPDKKGNYDFYIVFDNRKTIQDSQPFISLLNEYKQYNDVLSSFQVIHSKEVISFAVGFLGVGKNNLIVNKHPLIVKTLNVVYFQYCLGYDKVFMLDDDTVVRDVLDSFFDLDYYFTRDGYVTVHQTRHSEMENVAQFNKVFGTSVDYMKYRDQSINSGSYMVSKNNALLALLKRYFANKYFYELWKEENRTAYRSSKCWYFVEQNFWNFYRWWLEDNGYSVTVTNKNVKLLYRQEWLNKINKQIKVIHYILKQRKAEGDFFHNRLNEIFERDGEFIIKENLLCHTNT